MPVNAVAPHTAPAVPAGVSGSNASTHGPTGTDASFDALLGRAMGNPSDAPTVTLAGMVAALAGQPVEPSAIRPELGPGAAGGGATAAPRVGDAGGGSAGRPNVANAGAGAAVLAAGERYLGTPYKWGGTSPTTGFDCSGFVQRVFADLGVSLPRVSVDQSKQGTAVQGGIANARPGDLLFWRGSNGRPNHIAIYAGDNRTLEAPRTGDVVRYKDLTRTPDAIRRVL